MSSLDRPRHFDLGRLVIMQPVDMKAERVGLFSPETVYILVLHHPRAGACGKIHGFEPIVTKNPVKSTRFCRLKSFAPFPSSVQIGGALSIFARQVGSQL